MFEDFLGLLVLLGGIGLIVSAVRQQGRIALLEREIGALRSLVLSLSMASAKAPAPAAPGRLARRRAGTLRHCRGSCSRGLVPRTCGRSARCRPGKPVEPPQPQSVPDQPQPMPAPKGRPDIETALGTRWAVWVGGVALALGGLFLVRYTIEAGYFGPAARVTLAAIFGLALAAAGEFLRRTGYRLPVEGAAGAYIPAILTAAGAFTLFGAVYAAHGVYGFIGPTLAFLLLGLIGLGTLTLALLHGQALAGAGLLGAMATPLLVSSQAPNIWVLFGYIAIVLAFSTAVARLRGWIFLVSGAFVASGLWTLLYMAEAGAADVPTSPTVVLFIGLVSLAALGLIWFGRLVPDLGPSRIETAGPLPGAVPAAFLGLSTLILLADIKFEAVNGPAYGTVLALAMLGVALWRQGAMPLVYGAGIAVMVAYLRVALAGDFSVEMMGETVDVEGLSGVATGGPMRLVGALLGIAFLAAGVWRARALQASNTFSATSWASFAGAVPLVITIAVWLGYGNLDRDLTMAVVAVLLAVALAAGGEWTARALPMAGGRGLPVTILLSAAFAAWILALHMAFGSWLTTILVGASAALPAFATRTRTYPVLGALSVAAAVITLIRVAIDPTLVGLEPLSTTPVFNALLPGYGIPALAFAFAAWQLARTTGGRPRLAMEAAAALFGLLTVAMLVRHAMNGGVIYGAAPEPWRTGDLLARRPRRRRDPDRARHALPELRVPLRLDRHRRRLHRLYRPPALPAAQPAVHRGADGKDPGLQPPVPRLSPACHRRRRAGALCPQPSPRLVRDDAGGNRGAARLCLCDALRPAPLPRRVHRPVARPRAARDLQLFGALAGTRRRAAGHRRAHHIHGAAPRIRRPHRDRRRKGLPLRHVGAGRRAARALLHRSRRRADRHRALLPAAFVEHRASQGCGGMKNPSHGVSASSGSWTVARGGRTHG